jgi:hypothetical protein
MSVSRCSEFGSGRLTAYTDRTRKSGLCPDWRQSAHDQRGRLRPIGGRGMDPPWCLQSLIPLTSLTQAGLEASGSRPPPRSNLNPAQPEIVNPEIILRGALQWGLSKQRVEQAARPLTAWQHSAQTRPGAWLACPTGWLRTACCAEPLPHPDKP